MKNLSLFLGVFLMINLMSCHSATKRSTEITKEKAIVTNSLSVQKDYSYLTDSLGIDEQLVQHKLPGFSLVVFENYEVVYSNQWGVKSTTSNEKIDKNTSFSTASISKPITGLLCLILEEKGLINLDDPIDNYLSRWNLPKSEFTEDIVPTWKHFLNHTAGTTQHGFADFYEGDTIPTIKESLLGKLPRYDKEIEFTFEPGTNWSYSGGGYVVIQMALEDHFKTSIAALAKEYIFAPLELTHTTMTQPNEANFLTNFALVHDKEGNVIETGLPITPQVAPSGMWSTPEDLAKITIALQKALSNEKTNIISNQVAKKLCEVTALKNAFGGWSYGWQRSFGFDNYDWLMCNGSNTGVGGDIMATMENGNGFIYLANGDKPNRFPVINNTRQKLLEELKWEKPIKTNDIAEVPADLKTQLLGTYKDFLYGQKFPATIVEKENKLYVESPFFHMMKGVNASEMVYLKDGTFKVIDYPNYLKFDFNSETPKVICLRDDITFESELVKMEK